MDQDLIRKYGSLLERVSWFLVFFGMLSQVSTEVSFPSYNIALGFWGAYCSFSKHGRATFGYISFCFLALLLDIIFCSLTHKSSAAYLFSLVMLVFCMFTKVFGIYYGSHFFASIGGAYSMESSMTGSVFDNLEQSQGGIGGYYAPNETGQAGGLTDSTVF